MGLTDKSLYYSLIVLSIAAFISTIYLWPKLAPKKVPHIVGRFGILLLTNLLIVTTLGISLNNYGGFYTSWSDAFGIQSNTTTLKDAVNLSSTAKRISASDLKHGKISASGTVTIERILNGKQSGAAGHVWIVLPKSAVNEITKNKSQADLSKYRVLQFLPGFPGTPLGWINRLHIVNFLESAWKTKKLPPAIAVLTDTNLRPGVDGECMNIPHGPQIETWLNQDVHDFASSLLGVLPNHWVVFGSSTGGWCAAELAIRHPDHYIAGASIAGYFSPEPSKAFDVATKAKLANEYDLRQQIKNRHPAVQIFATVAPSDHGSYFQTIHFVNDMGKLIPIQTVQLTGQGHNFDAWLPAIAPALRWAGNILNKAGAHGI